MKIVCPSCNAVYDVSEAKLPRERSATARCKRCGGRVPVPRAGAGRAFPPLKPAHTSPGAPPSLTVGSAGGGGRAVPDPDETALPYGDALRFGWQSLKEDPVFVIVGMCLAPAIVQSVGNAFMAAVPKDLWPVSLLLGLVLGGVNLAVGLGVVGAALMKVDGRPTGFTDLLRFYPLTWTYLLSALLAVAAVGLGFVLLILPGIYLMLALQFWVCFIIDDRAGPVAALKRSYALTRGCLLQLFLFCCLVLGVNLVGVIPCGFGLLVTVPVTSIGWVYIYRFLRDRQPEP
jgi:predicted Zn finger-like uncharacterized protein